MSELVLGVLPKPMPGETVWVACSGGLDSSVLLHKLSALKLPLKSVHVNHHLQASAGRWADHCREFSARLNVPVYVVDVSVDPRHPDGPEAAARAARYGAFRSLMKVGDHLVTAHHQDDQAETVLLRLMRGAGVAGLAAMRPVVPFPPGKLWRPLLQRSREELRRYAEAHGLHWIEDPHNLDPRYSRTFVRHELFPRLQQRWPQAVELMARSAAHCAEATRMLDELAAVDFKDAVIPAKAGIQSSALSVRRLLLLPETRRSNVLRFWVAHGNFEIPSYEAMTHVEKEVLRARPDSSPVLAWGDTELRRFRDRLYLMPRLGAPPGNEQLEWTGLSRLELPAGCGWLEVLAKPDTELALRVGFARGGERLKPAGSRFTRTLRNLFQEEGIPGWIRERVPLIHLDGDLVAVANRWLSAPFAALCKKKRFQYAWRHELPGDSASA